jgi:hypothetical protein
MAARDLAARAATGELEAASVPAAAPPELRRSSSFEYRSRLKIGSLPIVHFVRGIDPSTGTRPPAIGVIAVGQVAIGAIAIGQLAIGGIAVGQAAVGLGWGIGQLACGLLAAGQVAAGTLGAVGQVALGPHPLGLVQDHSPWAAITWIVTGMLLGLAMLRRLRRVGPLVGAGTGPLAKLSSVRDGMARVGAHVLSDNTLRAPLSNLPCVFWHGVRVGPGIRFLERGGGDITVADATGTARVDLRGALTFIRNETYTELPAPDWSLYMETFLAQGDVLYVAGPVSFEPDPESQGAYRPGGMSPVFRGEPDHPLVVTTQPPDQIAAELRAGITLAVALVGAGLVAFGQIALFAVALPLLCAVGARRLGPQQGSR